MPIAEHVGVQFDMQLLLKLSVSVAAVLLVSAFYRFYTTRNVRRRNQPCVKGKDSNNATCQNCKTRLRQNTQKCDIHQENKQPNTACDDLTSNSTEEMPAGAFLHETEKSENALKKSHSDQKISIKEETPPQHSQAPAATGNVSFRSSLNTPNPAESGMASAAGRRSPCFLQKLKGSVGVGRELRQDLERLGNYSSFFSKAEIKVEDAEVVLEGTGDQVVHGKIYNYYVESSSHSITDSNRADAHYERSPESPPVDFGRHSSSPIEGTPTLSTIIMRDLVSPTNTVENASLRKNATRPILLRKESYLSATEDTQLSIPVKTSDSKKVNNVAPNNNEATCLHPVFSPSSDTKAVNVKEEVDRETVARASFPHLPTNLLNGTDFEVLKNNLDLGNCLETLFLAKRHGQMSLQQAALGVMSNNYLQVLRDPNLYGRLMAGEREQILKQRMRGRKFVMVADIDPQDWVINTVGETAKTKQGTRSSAVYYYDDYKDSWHRLCMIPLEVVSQACAVCTMDNYLFVAVGCQGTDREMTPSKRVFCYNPLTSIWKEISPMNESRPRCKLAALDGYIYAIGGECLSSVEHYDPRLDRWSYVAPLPNDTFAVAHHVTVANGELYVSGGTLRYMLLRYNPSTNTWKSSMLAGGKDRTADMMAVGRFLYRFDVNPMLGVSVYRYHLVARLWYECSCKRLQRCPTFQCVTMNNLIYCVSRQFTISFDADEISPAFTEENLSVLNAAKGILFPFVLSLPDKNLRQTSV